MFGADTNLILGALQMAGIAAAITGGAVYLVMRRRKVSDAGKIEKENVEAEKSDLEERVRVLERIATDRSVDLADEIEALRKPSNPTKEQAQ